MPSPRHKCRPNSSAIETLWSCEGLGERSPDQSPAILSGYVLREYWSRCSSYHGHYADSVACVPYGISTQTGCSPKTLCMTRRNHVLTRQTRRDYFPNSLSSQNPQYRAWVERHHHMATIKAIEGRSVHQIQSGQVIVDLISVVKELVENSLDAGATSIDIRFKNHGLDGIEVQDNGNGIAPEDFETIALKHYTSKLSSYEDLTSLDTFGFRGEALSSLCALSKFNVVTARAEDGAVGKKLDFEVSGKLKNTSVVAAQRGTTVAVESLFCNLPVRRKELEKNVKREYGKVMSQLHAYACISVGVRFAVSNQMPKGKKIALFSTKSNTTTKENITNVFGAKTLLALVKLDLHLEMEPSKGQTTQSARNWATQATDRSMEVRVQGHISKPIFGEGRQAPDRQMFFVNSRPCSLPQVSKAFNEVYKAFNVSQSPFIFANLLMDTNAYDVNVSPDKRSIMLHDQTLLLENLKAALTELFEQTDHAVPQSQLPSRKLPGFKPLTVPRRSSTEETAPAAEDEFEDSEGDEEGCKNVDSHHSRANVPTSGTGPSLIQNWIGRDSENRRETPTPKKQTTNLSNDKQQLLKALDKTPTAPITAGDDFQPSLSEEATVHPPELVHKSPVKVDLVPALEQRADPMSTPYDHLFSQRPAHLTRRVQDFNALMDLRHHHPVNPNEVDDQPVADAEHTAKPEREPIPAVAPSSQKATPGPIQNAFDRMRTNRTPLQTAEITIGDTTTTTVIGSSPPCKRRRVHKPVNSQAIAQFGGSPHLARGLRNFAAPGSQLQIDSSDISAVGPAESSDEEPDEASEAKVHVRKHGTEVDTGNIFSRSKAPAGSDVPTSEPLDALLPAPFDDDEYDQDYVDEHQKKIEEDEKVAHLIQEAEFAAAQPTEDNLRRASQALKNGGNRKEATLHLATYVGTSIDKIEKQLAALQRSSVAGAADLKSVNADNAKVKNEIDGTDAENRLSLTVSKVDFARMTTIGQFNLGFILAVRPASNEQDEDELFIIDQHAADEKYNYERLQRTVTLQSQRLVRPKPLELTAVEEEIILNNSDALKANGFEIETTSYDTDEESAGRHCRLITLPISGEKTFDTSDLEELLHLLSEAPAGGSEIPRPKKVQRMLAMRACRSSIMVGKTLTLKQMQKVVRHMGEMEKPWNCPHGRPTMRHLAGLGAWAGWQEGDLIDEGEGGCTDSMTGTGTDWKAWLNRRK